MRSAAILLLACGCASTGSREIADSFRRERERVIVRVPNGAGVSPGAAVNASSVMAGTVAACERVLARKRGDEYASAILACARLIRGEAELAKATLAGHTPAVEESSQRAPLLFEAASFATSACRCIEARAALADVMDRGADVTAFLRRYGGLVGLEMPDPSLPDMEAKFLAGVEEWRRAHLSEVEGDPRALERTSANRRAVRRRLGEQLYNDTVGLLIRLPGIASDNAEGADLWLTQVACGLLITYSFQMPDILPPSLGEEQKQWLREQALGAYERAREAARRLLDDHQWEDLRFGRVPPGGDVEADRDYLLCLALLQAQQDVMGWISTRG